MELTEFLYGKDFTEDLKKYEAEVKTLDEKYANELDEEDNVEKHILLNWDQGIGKITISFMDDVLSKEIQDDVLEIFYRVFGAKDKS